MFRLYILGCFALMVQTQPPQFGNEGQPPYTKNQPYNEQGTYNQQGGLYGQQGSYNDRQGPVYGQQNTLYNQQGLGYPPQGGGYNQDPLYNQRPQYPTNTQGYFNNDLSNDILYDLHCPEHWVRNYQSCYRFIKSPLRPYEEARRLCKVYN